MISDNILLWKLEKGSSSADEEQEQSNRWSDGKAKPRRGRAKKTAKSEEDGGVNDSESCVLLIRSIKQFWDKLNLLFLGQRCRIVMAS